MEPTDSVTSEVPPDPGRIYIAMFSIHGLVRGDNIEFGRDADTGGQIKYVVELARALSFDPRVASVELFTRQVFGRNIDPIYAQPVEPLTERARIVRIPAGPRRYLLKENLWPYVDSFVDNTVSWFRRLRRLPDIIHGHYADAGFVGSQLSRLLGVPFVFTGHSLGRVKRERLLAKGQSSENVDRRYHFLERIEAEEHALETASLVVTSTSQEIREQYESYDHYRAEMMRVIPPGVDLSAYRPPEPGERFELSRRLARFLEQPNKPLIFALARPDERKNLPALVRAFGKSQALRERANLLLVAGSREDIAEMQPQARRVVIDMLHQIDRYDLYGSVAFPKNSSGYSVPELYRLVALSGGVFANPALTEPFGLTLIEAAASGLPIVATHDGGPNDIVKACENGLLVDPLDEEAIAASLLDALSDRQRWTRWSKNGIAGAHRHYSWSAHVSTYLQQLEQLIDDGGGATRVFRSPRSRLTTIDRIVISDIDGTLTGDDQALEELIERLESAGPHVGFGVATGRRIDEVISLLEQHRLPRTDVLITDAGSEIYYGRHLFQDRSWLHHINFAWRPHAIQEALAELPGLALQDPLSQRPFKISYIRDPRGPSQRAIARHLRQRGLRAKCIVSHGMFVDIMPIRASSGQAVRFFAMKWGLTPDRILIAGDSGNDEEMLRGATLGVVVANYSAELERLRKIPNVYFASGEHARGVLEGIDYYNFTGQIRIPESRLAR